MYFIFVNHFICNQMKTFQMKRFKCSHLPLCNHIGGGMVSVLAPSVVDCGLEPQSGQIKDYEMGIY